MEFVLHAGPPWIRQNAAVPERSRSKFRAPLEPAEDLSVGQQAGRAAANIRARSRHDLRANQGFVGGGADLVVGIAAAEISMMHHKRTRLLEDRQVAVIGATNGDPIVPGGRLNPNIVKSGLPGNPSIRNAVECNSAGQTQVLGAGPLAQPDRAIEEGGFCIVLDPPGKVLPMLHVGVAFPLWLAVDQPGLVELYTPVRDDQLIV